MGVGKLSRISWLPTADRTSDWASVKVLVTGIGRSGFAAADALLELGASVIVVDSGESPANLESGKLLDILGAEVRLGADADQFLDEDVDLVVTSPGWRPNSAILVEAESRSIPVWGDVELAWRLMNPDRCVPWLGITGTNGKTTTTQMLASMLEAGGLRVATVGNIGRPIIEAINDEVPYDVFAVELSSFQLHYCHSLSLHSAVVLNLHPDHLEWYASDQDPEQAMKDYAADKAKIYHLVRHACVYNVDEPETEHMVEEAEVMEGARAIGFTMGTPAPSMLGIVDDLLVDRAFIDNRKDSALPLAQFADVQPFAPHNVENALAAAALARSFGVKAAAVAQGLRNLHLDGHRIQTIAEIDGVRYVDDSKATNPHAANASLKAFESVVWIAVGQAKGTTFDELISETRDRLRAAVLLGVDRGIIAEALSRHAPEVPMIVLDTYETRTITEAVLAAREFAQPGDTVLLAPGCASLDMWSSYAARGDDFAQAVRNL